MRRRRRRTDFRYRLYRFLRYRMPAPRRRRFRVVNHRRFMIAQAALALVVIVSLGLSASVVVRSIRTARLNKRLVALHTLSGDRMEAEIAAPPVGDSALAIQTEKALSSHFGELTLMGMPDGSPIQAPTQASPNTASVAAFHRTDIDILADMQKLCRENPDTVGWISISGTVHLPVVYRDNEFYLTHDFTGAKNASGTLFLDENSPITPDTQNLLIHGHSMNDGSMFGILTHYRKLDFLRQHPLISFSTLWEKESYAVFAVLLVSSKAEDANYFNYFDHASFASDAYFYDYIRDLKRRSKFEIPVDVESSDALLTMSTCIDDDRLVVVARRLRAGETKDELISAVETSCRHE